MRHLGLNIHPDPALCIVFLMRQYQKWKICQAEATFGLAECDYHRVVEKQVGEIHEVMVEGLSKKDGSVFSGRNRKNRIVNFISSKKLNMGDIVHVKITQAKKNSLFGEVI